MKKGRTLYKVWSNVQKKNISKIGGWYYRRFINNDKANILRATKNVSGVYIIFSGNLPSPSNTIYVGQGGDISDRLDGHLDNPVINSYPHLKVIWVEIPFKSAKDGIERYWADRFKPKVGQRHPHVTPISITLVGLNYSILPRRRIIFPRKKDG